MQPQGTRVALFDPPETCPRCGIPTLTPALPAGGEVNFLCSSCGSCWHFELGWMRLVPAQGCPGCEALPHCISQH